MDNIQSREEFLKENHKKIVLNYDKIRKTNDKDVKKFLDSISDEEIKKIWIDYRKIIKCASHDNPLTTDMELLLSEALINTYPVDKTVEYISSYFDFIPEQIEVYKSEAENNIFHIIVYIPVINDNLKLLEKAMSLCGYYLGWPKREKIIEGQFNKLQFEPMIQKDESKIIRKEEDKLLHLTPYYNVGKIKHIGFSPRSKNYVFEYPGRVYFMRGSTDEELIKSFGERLCTKNKSEGNNGEYALITIDINKIPENVKMYYDPNFTFGIYVTENIKPNVITNIDKITFK